MKVLASLLVVFGALFSLVGCQNVRSNPKPSQMLFKTALEEVQEVRGSNGEELDEGTIKSALAGEFNDETPELSLTTIKPDGPLSTQGYGHGMSLARIGLRTDKRFDDYKITDKPARGFVYSYSAKVTGLSFATPHMTEHSDSRVSLILHTKPESPYRVVIYYEDNSTAILDLVTYRTSRRYGGGYKSTRLRSFDGKLWLSPSFMGPNHRAISDGKYRLEFPYGT